MSFHIFFSHKCAPGLVTPDAQLFGAARIIGAFRNSLGALTVYSVT